MDIESYLLGKKAGGGSGDTSEYFKDEIYSGQQQFGNWAQCINKLPDDINCASANFMYLFRGYKGKNIPRVHSNNAPTTLAFMFTGCSFVEEIDITSFSTASSINMSSMFSGCAALKTIKTNNFDFSACTNVMSMFDSCTSLQNIGICSNIGKALTTESAENAMTFNVAKCPLTHDSIMNILNGLYDIASAGIKPQRVVLDAKNLAKVTAEELSVATNKGWNVQ